MFGRSRKKFRDRIFMRDDPAKPEKGCISALQHPSRGVVTDTPGMVQSLDFQFRVQQTPNVEAHLAGTPPWELPATGATGVPDPFRVSSRGSATSLASYLTRDAFDASLRSAGNNKATGVDMIPNELLKHMPVSYRDMVFSFFTLCWATGRTPAAWTHSETRLIHKKGATVDPANYRPIALHNSLYKLWTKTVTHVLQTYTEEVGMLSSIQEGFRKDRNCPHHLRYLTMLLEDAKLCKKDLFLLKIDFASAFNSVDHTCLLQIMSDLGYPADPVRVVRGLYAHATTSIVTTSKQDGSNSHPEGHHPGGHLVSLLVPLVHRGPAALADSWRQRLPPGQPCCWPAAPRERGGLC